MKGYFERKTKDFTQDDIDRVLRMIDDTSTPDCRSVCHFGEEHVPIDVGALLAYVVAEVAELREEVDLRLCELDRDHREKLQLRAAKEAAEQRCAELQARIDELMFEWCPEEMTPEQIATWEENQVRCSPEEEAAIKRALAAASPAVGRKEEV